MHTQYANYTEVLGLVLRGFRAEVQYTAEDMCKLLHISRERLTAIEFGRESVTFACAELYVQQTGHTVRQLLDVADTYCNKLSSSGVSLNMELSVQMPGKAFVTGPALWGKVQAIHA